MKNKQGIIRNIAKSKTTERNLLRLLSQPGLHSESKVALGYKDRSCLRRRGGVEEQRSRELKSKTVFHGGEYYIFSLSSWGEGVGDTTQLCFKST